MSFVRKATVAAATGTPKSEGKTDAYMNIYLPLADGSRVKLVYASLTESDIVHKQLISVYENDPVNGLNRIKDKLIIEINRKKPDEQKILDI